LEAPVLNRDILQRMPNNLKAIYLPQEDFAEARRTCR
jgi:regulator of sirC expression with transglutaminase-like and TPR domain